ncbi:hypothetical protein [Nocardia sp. NPDC004711]
MKSFEVLADGETYAATVFIQPNREALWAAAFGVTQLDGLFDMTPAEQAIPVVDAAISRFNNDPDALRPLVAADDPVGLRGNRAVLLQLRARLAKSGGTISGAVDESPERSA